MASITFTLEQRSTLEALTANGTANFYAGYDFLRAELEALTEVELAQMGVTSLQVEECIFWLTRASAINQNDLSSEANNFIRDVTRYGLLYDGKPAGTIQLNSNAIGEAVIGHVLQNSSFPPIDSIVGSDVQAAIVRGGQSVAGWGGAFYYWDAPYENDGVMSTVGGAILGDSAELEKFISIASKASYNAVVRAFGDVFDTGDIVDMLNTTFDNLEIFDNADIPLSLKSAISQRVLSSLLGLQEDPDSWETTIDLSNSTGVSQPGQHGFDINLITGDVVGFHSSNEDFETFATIVKVKGSDFGDRMNLVGSTPFIEIEAGAGDDKIFSGGGVVVADGGGGTDLFAVYANFASVGIVRAFNQIIVTGANFSYFLSDFDYLQFNDVIKDFAQLLADTVQNIDGTGLGDLVGTAWKDNMIGGAGRTVIAGLGGADTIKDTNWLVLDYSASDAGVRLARTSTTDTIFEGYGGHAQGDIIQVGSGSNRYDIIGSAYADQILYAYEVFAGDGNDIITGSEIVHAGDGYDTVNVTSYSDYIDFGAGGGELKLAQSTNGYFVDMQSGVYQRLSSGTVVHDLVVVGDFDKLTGSNYADHIHGTGGNDWIVGGGGLDFVYGYGGDDDITGTGSIWGGSGNDQIALSSGSAWGEDGNDTMVGGQGSFIHGGGGDDTLSTSAKNVTIIGGAGADSISFLTGSYATSTLSYAESSSGVTLWYTGTSILALGGDAEGDVISGAFKLIGSNYSDTFSLQGSQIASIDGLGGNDVFFLQGQVTATGGEGNDTFTLTARNQTAYGDEGNDMFSGHGRMYGGEGNDEFILSYGSYAPGAGSYVLVKVGGTVYSGAGENDIVGGLGNDTIWMGEGSNTFDFSMLGGDDRIYQAGLDDTFVLSDIAAFTSMDDVVDHLVQDGGNAVLELGYRMDHPDVYGSSNPYQYLGSITFVGMTTSAVAALNWDFA